LTPAWSVMRRTILIGLAAALGFGMVFGGHRLAYRLFIDSGPNFKDTAVTVTLVELFVVFPLMSILIGALVGFVEDDKHWWLSGLALAPILAYFCWHEPALGVVILCLSYEALTMATAFLAARLRLRFRSPKVR